MNLLRLILKQMRQRSLSTWLTMLSVVLGVGLATSIQILRHESHALFGQTDYGYDVLIGAKGSPLQLVLNTAYHIDRSPGNIPYSIFEAADNNRQFVKTAVPFGVGDTYQGHRIIGTLPRLFGVDDRDGAPLPPEQRFNYRPGRSFEMAEGKVFHPEKFEAVVGADIPRLTGLRLGDKFKATHGMPVPGQTPDEHDTLWTVIGVLKPTHTANDRVLFIPLTTFYAISEHEDALEAISAVRKGKPASEPESHNDEHGDEHGHHGAFDLNADGTIHLHLPKAQWMVSAVLVRSRGAFQASSMMYELNNGTDAQAVNPAMTMRQFFDVFLEPSARMLQGVALLVTVVAAVSILVSIYNAVAARLREIAILRALGATRLKILALICGEAAMIGLIGGAVGILIGHLVAAGGSVITERLVGERIDWISIRPAEGAFLAATVLLSALAGLVPALKAYRTPVATNLVAV